jgi:hypothetical protein
VFYIEQICVAVLIIRVASNTVNRTKHEPGEGRVVGSSDRQISAYVDPSVAVEETIFSWAAVVSLHLYHQKRRRWKSRAFALRRLECEMGKMRRSTCFQKQSRCVMDSCLCVCMQRLKAINNEARSCFFPCSSIRCSFLPFGFDSVLETRPFSQRLISLYPISSLDTSMQIRWGREIMT